MPTGKAVKRFEQNIYYLDSRKVNPYGVSGVYLIIGEGITLIETGTALVTPHILQAVHDIGFRKRDIKRAIVTHVHLDHAGGTGVLVSQVPHLQVYVHKRGLSHLRDPSRLIDSARAVYGDVSTIHAIHGEIVPVPSENLIPATDAEIDIGGGIRLEIIEAPGHAPHHLCIHEPASGSIFTGEVLGHNHPETGILHPAVAPPGFNYDDSMETIRKIRQSAPRSICFSQFGWRRDISYVLDESVRQLKMYHDFILKRLREGQMTGEIIEEMGEERSKAMVGLNIHSSMLVSLVAGFQIYFQRAGKLDVIR
jgi:glyoxylase-like metal-dependent hydrolase (beta-lactamase superfamily II)